MKFDKRFFAAGVVSVALVAGGAMAANAGTTLIGFNTVAPQFGGAGYSGLQTKAISSHPGLLTQVTVGGGYSIHAKQCVGANTSCGTTVAVGSGANLPNNISAGTPSVVAQMWVPNFNLVNVQVTGYFASN
ncbi:hypothetical protein [Homoserinimonas hongtaonis]|uniref:Uncharacterized protein n=1 Tax=Homoserinimonas hongtaonis TaxID=2079791 RepID=A0A2U1T0Z0_9MICO|nr:hypothetical protein [Salinibacterium hongtaonis]AWB90101.1 hypothetical protein C2138_11605 [Salinibacterium hongtaonis]PWB97555.1 hypothetical protein DF220_06720 [Salinibacterium hongtaonis]